MPEPFKNLFNREIIRGMAEHFQLNWPQFDGDAFLLAASNQLEELELKQRSNQIKDAMIQYLPEDFEHSGQVMLASLGKSLDHDLSEGKIDQNGIAGWAVMPMVDYVGEMGQAHFDLSMTLFKEMTKRSSSEFGIRYFLRDRPVETLAVLRNWVDDENVHVRRLVSEGTRPRLPWGMRLQNFVVDPMPVIHILEKLKDDSSEYVRRSVANNLNDISKDHPDKVSEIAGEWLRDASADRTRLVQHACRSLIKQGDQKTLAVFGYGVPVLSRVSLKLQKQTLKLGDALELVLNIFSDEKRKQPLIVDYIVHHIKANGKLSPKVFKWKKCELVGNGQLSLTKKHAMKKVTTRKYYSGSHLLEVVINGKSVAKKSFELIVE